MITFFAGVPGGGTSGWCRREKELTPMWHSRLWTYFWMTKDKGIMEKPKTVNLFLDSGAYSALTQQTTIDIKDYIAFIKEHKKYIDLYANLDVIAEANNDPLKAKADAAQATLKNQKIMEKAGLNPLPVFHYGEPFDYLEKYLAKYPYIAIGGLVGVPTGLICPWLDVVFSKYICDSKGMPKVKVHGFGMTSLVLMLRYPWYSVDSTSWVVTGRMGSIYVPRFSNGKWIYDVNSHKIAVSTKNPNVTQSGKHISTLSPAQRKVVVDYVESKGYKIGKSSFHYELEGYELKPNERWAEKKEEMTNGERLVEVIEEEGVSNRYQLRDELNIIYFNDLEKTMPQWPWKFKVTHSPKLF